MLDVPQQIHRCVLDDLPNLEKAIIELYAVRGHFEILEDEEEEK